jgi:hypothetical protein
MTASMDWSLNAKQLPSTSDCVLLPPSRARKMAVPKLDSYRTVRAQAGVLAVGQLLVPGMVVDRVSRGPTPLAVQTSQFCSSADSAPKWSLRERRPSVCWN